MTLSVAQLLGRGIAFPPGVTPEGRLRWSQGDPNVRESLRIILLTEPGERVMRPEFGCGLRRLLFEPNTPATRRMIQEEIRLAVTRWEPRVRLEGVDVTDTPDPRRVRAVIRYQLVGTGVREQVALDLDLEV